MLQVITIYYVKLHDIVLVPSEDLKSLQCDEILIEISLSPNFLIE